MKIITIWTDEIDFSLTDQDMKISKWATENCPSYNGYEILDMSDIDSWDGAADTGYQFSFLDDKDAVLFSLKWL